MLLIAGICLLLGLLAGFVMHRSDYCLAGMFRDLFLFRSGFMLRTLVLLVGLSTVLFEGARLADLLPRYPFPLLGPPSLTGVLGGAAFGVGMVLAGGCVVGTLYKLGSGSVLSAVAFLGLIAGSGLYAEFHPQWQTLVRATVLTSGAITLPQVLGVPPTVLVLPGVAAATLLGWRWQRRGGWTRSAAADGYLQPWKAAVALAAIGVASSLAVAMPLGITTCYAKLAAVVGGWLAPAHTASLGFFSATPLDVHLERFSVDLVGGPGPGWDGVAAVQGMLILGIVLGALVSCLLLGEFRIRARAPARQYASALAGGMLLALGSRMGAGCNVWHLLGGLPIFSLQGLVFLAGLLPGAWVGTRVLVRVVTR